VTPELVLCLDDSSSSSSSSSSSPESSVADTMDSDSDSAARSLGGFRSFFFCNSKSVGSKCAALLRRRTRTRITINKMNNEITPNTTTIAIIPCVESLEKDVKSESVCYPVSGIGASALGSAVVEVAVVKAAKIRKNSSNFYQEQHQLWQEHLRWLQ
jgi:hypothetical protein